MVFFEAGTCLNSSRIKQDYIVARSLSGSLQIADQKVKDALTMAENGPPG